MSASISVSHRTTVAWAAPLPVLQRLILRQLMAVAPFQPATNFWRAIELPALAGALPAEGQGLDVGCGDGELTRLLAELLAARWQLIGVDPDPAEAAHAEALGLYRHVHATTADRIPEPDGACDFAFANSVLEHIPNLPDCLREIARCLKPDGLFVATVPGPAFSRLLGGPSRWRRTSREAYCREIDERLAHVNYWSPQRWDAELLAAGLTAPTITGYLSRRQVQRWETWSNWTGGLLYRVQGKRRQPIEIQRRLGLRRRLLTPLRFLARPLARLVSRGMLGQEAVELDQNGCLLVVSRKATAGGEPAAPRAMVETPDEPDLQPRQSGGPQC